MASPARRFWLGPARNLEQYGATIQSGRVTGLQKQPDRFIAVVEDNDGGMEQIAARRVVLATGSVDIEPDLPDMPNAVQRGLVRYCPICDGYESRDRKIAVIGYGAHGIGEAVFIARTYSRDVTLLTLGQSTRTEPGAAGEARRARHQDRRKPRGIPGDRE